jgi:prophage regulatory protein
MRFLSKKDVCRTVSLSRASIDRKEKDGQFPKRVTLGFRVAWVEDEVEDWMKARTAERDRPSTPP